MSKKPRWLRSFVNNSDNRITRGWEEINKKKFPCEKDSRSEPDFSWRRGRNGGTNKGRLLIWETWDLSVPRNSPFFYVYTASIERRIVYQRKSPKRLILFPNITSRHFQLLGRYDFSIRITSSHWPLDFSSPRETLLVSSRHTFLESFPP